MKQYLIIFLSLLSISFEANACRSGACYKGDYGPGSPKIEIQVATEDGSTLPLTAFCSLLDDAQVQENAQLKGNAEVQELCVANQKLNNAKK